MTQDGRELSLAHSFHQFLWNHPDYLKDTAHIPRVASSFVRIAQSMINGIQRSSRGKLHEKIMGLRRAGKSSVRYSEMLVITPSTIQYLASLYSSENPAEPSRTPQSPEQRLRLAYEMWRSGESFAEIARMLQMSPLRVRQMIHRYSWTLKQPK